MAFYKYRQHILKMPYCDATQKALRRSNKNEVNSSMDKLQGKKKNQGSLEIKRDLGDMSPITRRGT